MDPRERELLEKYAPQDEELRAMQGETTPHELSLLNILRCPRRGSW